MGSYSIASLIAISVAQSTFRFHIGVLMHPAWLQTSFCWLLRLWAPKKLPPYDLQIESQLKKYSATLLVGSFGVWKPQYSQES